MASNAPEWHLEGKRGKWGQVSLAWVKRLFTCWTGKEPRLLQYQSENTDNSREYRCQDFGKAKKNGISDLSSTVGWLPPGVDDPPEAEQHDLCFTETHTGADSRGIHLRVQASQDERRREDHRQRFKRMQRDKEDLKGRLTKATQGRKQLESELERVSKSLKFREQQNAAMHNELESTKSRSSMLEAQVSKMAKESEVLCRDIDARDLKLQGQQERLKAAETHIINLGSSFAALLSREEATSMFKVLLDQTRIWIADFVRPTMENAGDRLEVVRRAHQSGARDRLLRCHDLHPGRTNDFQLASSFRNTDEDIMLAMVFDFLGWHVFSTNTLYGSREPSLEKQMQLFQNAEDTMKVTTKTSKSLYTARRWASQARAALLRAPQVETTRQTFADFISDQLVTELCPMFPDSRGDSAPRHAAQSALRNAVVLPAIRMQDKMLCAVDRFTVERRDYGPSAGPPGAPGFFDDLPDLNCKNLGEGPRRFRPDKMKETPSPSDIQKRLRNICATTPALVLRETGDTEFGPPITLVKQEMLVAWDQPEIPRLKPEEEGLFWMLYRKWFPETAPEVEDSGLSSTLIV